MSRVASYHLTDLIGGRGNLPLSWPSPGCCSSRGIAPTTRYVLFDRALPISDSAADGRHHLDMSTTERLAALLLTQLEQQGRDGAVALALVRAALAHRRRTEEAKRKGKNT